MALDSKKLERPFRKLRKSLKKLPKRASPAGVHKLRTRTREVESAVQALSLYQSDTGRHVLKSITPVRKRAGKVRDMDVLTGLASSLNTASDDECMMQLLEYLGHKRFVKARKLHKTAVKHRKTAAHELERCASLVERRRDKSDTRSARLADAAATALQISAEIANWPKLTAGNLHPFRLKVKELRNVLQFAAEKVTLLKSLKAVKDAIGLWHDWSELAGIADDVLQQAGHCGVRAKIHAHASQQFGHALSLSNRMRSQYFGTGRSRARRPSTPSQPVLKATARLVA
jgi:CHAD domain-containing protein